MDPRLSIERSRISARVSSLMIRHELPYVSDAVTATTLTDADLHATLPRVGHHLRLVCLQFNTAYDPCWTCYINTDTHQKKRYAVFDFRLFHGRPLILDLSWRQLERRTHK